MTPTDEIGGRGSPPFDAPWQSQTYAMAQVLIESGRIASSDWSAALGAAIRRRLAAGAADTTETYFAAVTEALETVLAVDGDEVGAGVEAWRQAYETTPHGKPVRLKSDKS